MRHRLSAILVFVVALAACVRAPDTARGPTPAPPERGSPQLVEVVRPPPRPDRADELARSLPADGLAALERDVRQITDEILGDGAPINPSDFDIPLHLNDRVLFWKAHFRDRDPQQFAIYLTRKGRYEDFIRTRLRERGLPEDLVYVALVESGFSPRAYSRAHAVGIWQFIAETGRRYGLEVSAFVDERRDPVKATEAAIDYLEGLYDRFGSWYLAAAGYNGGENRVDRILRQRAGGRTGDDALFWQIAEFLPRETREYVPKILAAAILGKYPERYGFADVVPEDPERFETVTVPDATDLAVIAEAAGVTKQEIERLNPQFIRGYTPPGRSVQVRVPEGTGQTFALAYDRIPPEERVRFVEHFVRRGETLSHIARRYRTTIAELQAANNLRNAHRIAISQRLIIPRVASGASATLAPNTGATDAVVIHRVVPGDTLWSIARQHGVSPDQLRQWNNLPNTTIRPGDQVEVRLSR